MEVQTDPATVKVHIHITFSFPFRDSEQGLKIPASWISCFISARRKHCIKQVTYPIRALTGMQCIVMQNHHPTAQNNHKCIS